MAARKKKGGYSLFSPPDLEAAEQQSRHLIALESSHMIQGVKVASSGGGNDEEVIQIVRLFSRKLPISEEIVLNRG